MEKSHTSNYIIGFILSLILTLAAYFAVVEHLFIPTHLRITIGVLALAQAAVQLIFFLRMGQEQKPHWKLMVFLFMLLVLIIIVFGTLWIMYSLNYNLMTNTTMEMGAY
jgi:cytochrome o ubiquinol oxidase operon protein cyoD